MSSAQCAAKARAQVAHSQWKLPDGAVGTQVGEHQGELVLMVSRPNWPFPKAVVISREVCERIEPRPMDTNQQEEARW